MLGSAMQKPRFIPGSWIRSYKIVILNVVVSREVLYTRMMLFSCPFLAEPITSPSKCCLTSGQSYGM